MIMRINIRPVYTCVTFLFFIQTNIQLNSVTLEKKHLFVIKVHVYAET